MVNTNIQAVVPLVGKGLVNKPSNDFKPGEYALLTNAEVTLDGTLRGRRALSVLSTTSASFSNTWSRDGGEVKPSDFRFLGEMSRYVIAGIGDKQVAIRGDSPYSIQYIWPQSDLPVGEWLVGAFFYNNRYYWITQNNHRNNVLTKQVYIYHIAYDFNIQNITYASLTKVAAFDPGNNKKVTNFFLHKDRLFIVAENGVWFSKATDPTIWAVPDGGFVKLDDKIINYAFSLGNSIYILTNRGIDLFTYSIDPNEDPQVRTIVSNFASIAGCVHKSTPYVASRDGIFSLSNGYLERLCSFGESYNPGTVTRKTNLVSMDDSLLFIHQSNSTPPFKTAIVFNLETQALHTMWMPTNLHGVPYPEGGRNTIVDAFTPSWSETITPSESKTFFLLNYDHHDGVLNDSTQTFYKMIHGRGLTDNIRGMDYVLTLNNGKQYMPIRYDVEIRDIQPDNNKFLKKKFRSLQLLGRMPSANFKLSIAIDGVNYTRVHPLRGSNIDPIVELMVNDQNAKDAWGGDSFLRMPPAGHVQSPHTFRIPINQRGVSISLKFEVENWQEYIAQDIAYQYDPFDGRYRGLFEVLDLRYNWTYLGRPSVFKNNTVNEA